MATFTTTPQQTAYEMLGFTSSNVSNSDLKKEHHKRAMQTHPDKKGDGASFGIISNLFKILLNETYRKIYDDALASGMQHEDALKLVNKKIDKDAFKVTVLEEIRDVAKSAIEAANMTPVMLKTEVTKLDISLRKTVEICQATGDKILDIKQTLLKANAEKERLQQLAREAALAADKAIQNANLAAATAYHASIMAGETKQELDRLTKEDDIAMFEVDKISIWLEATQKKLNALEASAADAAAAAKVEAATAKVEAATAKVEAATAKVEATVKVEAPAKVEAATAKVEAATAKVEATVKVEAPAKVEAAAKVEVKTPKVAAAASENSENPTPAEAASTKAKKPVFLMEDWAEAAEAADKDEACKKAAATAVPAAAATINVETVEDDDEWYEDEYDECEYGIRCCYSECEKIHPDGWYAEVNKKDCNNGNNCPYNKEHLTDPENIPRCKWRHLPKSVCRMWSNCWKYNCPLQHPIGHNANLKKTPCNKGSNCWRNKKGICDFGH
jgi:curved DNA-binding protein CbpA